MAATLGSLEKIGIFVVGGLVRLGIFLAVLAAIAVPLVVIAWAINRVRARRRRAMGLHEVSGVTVRPGVRYAPGHTWLLRRGEGTLEIGMDDLALRLLPAVTAVEAVRTGTRVKRGETIVTLWGGGRQLPIRAPFDARISGVNSAVVRDPSLVRSDGYGKGWLVALEPANEQWSALPSDAAADGWMAAEARRWNQQLERSLGIAAADGGELITPAPWLLGEDRWSELAAAFTDPGVTGGSE
ncbi:MAG: glycine cleavage system protein H [Anaeromyxobacteraceae bacterium]